MAESDPFRFEDQILIMDEREQAIRNRFGAMERIHFKEAFWAKDARLWKREPEDPAIVGAMGWLDVAEKMEAAVPELEAFAKEVEDAGFFRAMLAGMGGSSL